jgi:hypothetical protein
MEIFDPHDANSWRRRHSPSWGQVTVRRRLMEVIPRPMALQSLCAAASRPAGGAMRHELPIFQAHSQRRCTWLDVA